MPIPSPAAARVAAAASTAWLAALLIAAPAGHAEAASFNCDQSGLAADETAICANRALNDADVRMVTSFELIAGLMPMGSRSGLEDEQVAWLTLRRTCGADVECLAEAYKARLARLQEVYGNIERPR